MNRLAVLKEGFEAAYEQERLCGCRECERVLVEAGLR